MTVYPILSLECVPQVGGVQKAEFIAKKIIASVGGLSTTEYKELTHITVDGNQVSVYIKDKVTANRVMHWKPNIKWLLRQATQRRQITDSRIHNLSMVKHIME